MVDSIRRLESADSPEERAQIARDANQVLNVQTLARRALGDTWNSLNAAQRQEFVELLTQMLERVAYPKAAQFFSGLEVEYSDSEAPGAGKARVVHTTVTRPEGGAVVIDYVVGRQNGRYQISDILLDGESLAGSVAEQVQAVLKQGSYKDLVDRMRKRLEQIPSEQPGPPEQS